MSDYKKFWPGGWVMSKAYRIIFLATVLALVSSCAMGPKVEPGSGSPPVIDEYYASPTADYSRSWKIFIKAHDPDGDMWRVRFKIDQPYVLYKDVWGYVFLPKRAKEKMDGFFYMLTPLERLPEGSVELTVSVTLIDEALNKSETIKLPLTFGFAQKMEPDPEGYQDDALLPIPYRVRSKFSNK
jgi:hypothetical protein